MNSAEFRKELLKLMPGYAWTVHKTANPEGYQSATGIQSSGFNRLSTLKVIRTEKTGQPWYEVKSAPHGTKSPWAHTASDRTLARALRELQTHYERQVSHFHVLACRLQAGRQATPASDIALLSTSADGKAGAA